MARERLTKELPPDARGLRLCKMRGEELILYEIVMFDRGRPAVLTTLNRAELSGRVEVEGSYEGDLGDFWADVMSDPDNMVSTVRLDRGSWNSLKNHWMRCRLDMPEPRARLAEDAQPPPATRGGQG